MKLERNIMSTAIRVELTDAVVRFGGVLAVDHLSLTVEPGEILALLGPSGCGKTTTLRVMAGLQALESGALRFDSRVMNDVAPHRRNVGMVFQNYALFPHMTIRQNVLFGLQMHGSPRGERATRVKQILELLHIGNLADFYPDQLSGGQQQRAALARTLVVEPSVLLLDEPLSALDRQLRETMRADLRNLLKTVNITAVIVTHDQDEALTVADRVAVMRNGRIEQIGSPRAIYEKPETRFVASFIGQTNYLPGKVEKTDSGLALIRLCPEVAVRAVHGGGLAVGAVVDVAVRPESIVIMKRSARAPIGWNSAVAAMERCAFLGGLTISYLRLQNGQVISVSETQNARMEKAGLLDSGVTVQLIWPVESSVILHDAESPMENIDDPVQP